MATLCFKNPYVMNIYVSKYSKYLDDNQNYAKHNISMTQIHNYFVFWFCIEQNERIDK